MTAGDHRDDEPIDAAADAPPAFRWDEWYQSIGGRKIAIPEVDEVLREIYEEQFPRFDGATARTRADLGSEAETANAIKNEARRLGADMVGICALEPSDLYRGRVATERFAIALGKAMRYRAFARVPTRESAIECVRIYRELGEICIALADYVRARGWDCTVEHPIGDADVLHIPIALKAGFGELGRHGSVIHPTYGPLFRMGSVLTSLPMALDAPIDAGIADVCDSCRACRIYCPADAIPDERDPEAGVDHLGNPRFVVDTGKCFSYFAEHEYCSACLPVCIVNRPAWAFDRDGAPTPTFPEVLFENPPPPADAVPEERRHSYRPFARDGFVPEWKLRQRRRARGESE